MMPVLLMLGSLVGMFVCALVFLRWVPDETGKGALLACWSFIGFLACASLGAWAGVLVMKEVHGRSPSITVFEKPARPAAQR